MAEGPSLLELCRELAYRMLAHCNFCPWNCRVDRSAGAKFGACKLASASRVSSHFHHTGEELFYRGTEGSGTIFFTSCNMRCAFCQNARVPGRRGYECGRRGSNGPRFFGLRDKIAVCVTETRASNSSTSLAKVISAANSDAPGRV
jgi:hypothetical protein